MKKVKTISEVYIRTRTPYLKSDNKKGVLYPGFEIEVEEVTGEEIDGNSLWYRDKNGDFYWSGGFEEHPPSPVKITYDSFQLLINESFQSNSGRLLKSVNYNELLKFDDDIKKSKGNDSIVAILDAPIRKRINVFDNRILDDDFDIRRIGSDHGTLMASLIGANQTDEPGIIGIAPSSRLLQLPLLYRYKGTSLTVQQIEKFLDRNYNGSRLIINASLAYNLNDVTPEIESFYKNLTERYIVVASAGEDGQLIEGKQLQFPSSLSNVISVGVVSQQFIEENRNLKFNKNLDVLIKNYHFVGITHDNKRFFGSVQRDSAATAIVSGMLSLLLSSTFANSKPINKMEILNQLLVNSISYRDALTNNELILINPKL